MLKRVTTRRRVVNHGAFASVCTKFTFLFWQCKNPDRLIGTQVFGVIIKDILICAEQHEADTG